MDSKVAGFCVMGCAQDDVPVGPVEHLGGVHCDCQSARPIEAVVLAQLITVLERSVNIWYEFEVQPCSNTERFHYLNNQIYNKKCSRWKIAKYVHRV